MDSLVTSIFTFLKERKWDNLRPGNIAKSISIESAELLEIFQWNDPTLDEVKTNKKSLNDVEEEVADIIIYCLQMASLLNIDIEKAIEKKLEHASKKYPVEMFQDLEGDEENEKYLEIKRKYRKEKNC